MNRSARNSWRAMGTAAMLLPFLTLTACANSDQVMAEKLAAAEAAAARAEAAQHAAEKAAANAAAAHPAPAAEATDMANTSLEDNNLDSSDGGLEGHDDDVSMGTAPAIAPDVTAVPNNGA